jgi:hypothetical protein
MYSRCDVMSENTKGKYEDIQNWLKSKKNTLIN